MPVGRGAPIAAAVWVVAAMNIAVGALTAASLIVLDLPTMGSLVLGASFTALGFFFVGVTLVAAQITETPASSVGIAGGVLGLSFVLRAIGDVGDGTLSWFSPIGIAEKSRPYGGDVWWPLLLLVALAAGLAVVAAWLAARRTSAPDSSRPRPGPATASPAMGSPIGLAVRLQRGIVWWWGVAVFLAGVAYGSIADSIEDFIADSEALEDIVARVGADSVVDAYLATTMLILALIAAGCGLQAVQRLRSEESDRRAEPVLATGTSRWRWAGSHLAVAFGGTALVLAAGGLGAGLIYGLVVGDARRDRPAARRVARLHPCRMGTDRDRRRALRSRAEVDDARLGAAQRVLRHRIARRPARAPAVARRSVSVRAHAGSARGRRRLRPTHRDDPHRARRDVARPHGLAEGATSADPTRRRYRRSMRIGLSGGSSSVERMVEQAQRAEADGFSTLWYASAVGGDPLVAMAFAGKATTSIELGTSVLQTYTCHPVLQVNRAASVTAGMGRAGFILGLGPSHKPPIEDMFGLSYATPGRHTEEYLQVLSPLLRGQGVEFHGDEFDVVLPGPVSPPPFPVSVMISALAPRMSACGGRAHRRNDPVDGERSRGRDACRSSDQQGCG